MEKISMEGMKCSSCCKPQDPWMWATDTLLWTVCPKQASSQPWKMLIVSWTCFRECLWAICWFSLRGFFIPFAPWKPESPVVPPPAPGHSWCPRDIVLSPPLARSWAASWAHGGGEEVFLCPHSLPSFVTPQKFPSDDAAVQSAPSWAAGLEPPSNSIKGALGQKEILVEFRKGLSSLRHSVHGFGRALCISSNA